MKLTKINGCYSSVTEIDGVDINDYNYEQLNVIADKLFQWLLANNYAKWIINSVIEYHGCCKYDDEPCEQCGNLGETYNIEIEL